MVTTGVAVLICDCMIICYVRNIVSVCGLVILAGVAHSMFWPAVQSWVSEKTGKQSLRTTLGIFNVAWSTGLMLGPLVAGLLFRLSYRLPFYSASGLAVIVLFMVLVAIQIGIAVLFFGSWQGLCCRCLWP